MKPLLWLLLLWLACGLVAAEPVAQLDPAAEDQQLAELARRAFEHPEPALAELRERWPTHAGEGQPRETAWLMAKGRMLLAAGQAEAAEAVMSRLAALRDGEARAWLLRALAQERQHKAAGGLARRALAVLEPGCPPGDEAASVREARCDWRSAWEALRMIQREQLNQGAAVSAEGAVRRSLALARAGGDRVLISLSHASLALALQAQEQVDAARAELRAAAAAVQGDLIGSARVRVYEALVERRLSAVEPARLALESALALAEQGDAPHLAAQVRASLVDAHMHLGQSARAIAQGQRALPVLQRYADRLYLRSLHHNLAVAHIKLRQFEPARQQLARVEALGIDPGELVPRAMEQRELAETWGEVGLHKEALAAYHAEHALNTQANERNREAALDELRRKHDSAARQRDLELLARDGQLKDQQLANRRLVQQVSIAVGLLLLLSLVLGGLTLARMRRAQARLTANQSLLRAQSERDPLTHLSNRRHFHAVMEQGSAVFQGALLMIDIDHFKNVNDRHGHAAGDAVIIEVARRIRAAVRDSDLVVRWGGEEFLVFAPGLTPADLGILAGRVLRGIGSQPMDTPDGPLAITASLGFASFPLSSERRAGQSPAPGASGHAGQALPLRWEQAVNWADMLLYQAKAEGRNRAIGIVGVDAPDPEALGEVLQDFDAACLRGQVRLTRLQGPG